MEASPKSGIVGLAQWDDRPNQRTEHAEPLEELDLEADLDLEGGLDPNIAQLTAELEAERVAKDPRTPDRTTLKELSRNDPKKRPNSVKEDSSISTLEDDPDVITTSMGERIQPRHDMQSSPDSRHQASQPFQTSRRQTIHDMPSYSQPDPSVSHSPTKLANTAHTQAHAVNGGPSNRRKRRATVDSNALRSIEAGSNTHNNYSQGSNTRELEKTQENRKKLKVLHDQNAITRPGVVDLTKSPTLQVVHYVPNVPPENRFVHIPTVATTISSSVQHSISRSNRRQSMSTSVAARDASGSTSGRFPVQHGAEMLNAYHQKGHYGYYHGIPVAPGMLRREELVVPALPITSSNRHPHRDLQSAIPVPDGNIHDGLIRRSAFMPASALHGSPRQRHSRTTNPAYIHPGMDRGRISNEERRMTFAPGFPTPLAFPTPRVGDDRNTWWQHFDRHAINCPGCDVCRMVADSRRPNVPRLSTEEAERPYKIEIPSGPGTAGLEQRFQRPNDWDNSMGFALHVVKCDGCKICDDFFNIELPN